LILLDTPGYSTKIQITNRSQSVVNGRPMDGFFELPINEDFSEAASAVIDGMQGNSGNPLITSRFHKHRKLTLGYLLNEARRYDSPKTNDINCKFNIRLNEKKKQIKDKGYDKKQTRVMINSKDCNKVERNTIDTMVERPKYVGVSSDDHIFKTRSVCDLKRKRDNVLNENKTLKDAYKFTSIRETSNIRVTEKVSAMNDVCNSELVRQEGEYTSQVITSVHIEEQIKVTKNIAFTNCTVDTTDGCSGRKMTDNIGSEAMEKKQTKSDTLDSFTLENETSDVVDFNVGSPDNGNAGECSKKKSVDSIISISSGSSCSEKSRKTCCKRQRKRKKRDGVDEVTDAKMAEHTINLVTPEIVKNDSARTKKNCVSSGNTVISISSSSSSDGSSRGRRRKTISSSSSDKSLSPRPLRKTRLRKKLKFDGCQSGKGGKHKNKVKVLSRS